MQVSGGGFASMRLFDDVSATPGDRVEHFAEVVERALDDERMVRQVEAVDCIVRIDLADALPNGVTLLLDRVPAGVVVGPADGDAADVRLLLDSADLEVICCEGLFLPMKIVSGEVRYEGPVRKFLRVLPVLRRAAQGTRAL